MKPNKNQTDDDRSVMLITGTSRGIGRFLAEYYVDKGWYVGGCSRTEGTFQHPHYQHQVVDVTDEAAVLSWVRTVVRQWQRIHVVINNAGIGRMNHALLTPAKTIDDLLNVHVKGCMLVCREVGKIMYRHNYGRIINFGSVAASLALEGEAVYASAKAAVATYSRALARELAPKNITVNVIAPLPIKTDLIRGVPEEKLQDLLARMAIPRYGTYEDVSNVLDFFISPRSTMITGQIVTLGGW